MTTRIMLVRHGEHDLLGRVLCGRMEGVGLNAAGHEQGRRLGELLAREAPGRVVSSPALRARQTGVPIAQACGVELEVAEALDEMDMGRWTGVGFDRLNAEPGWRWWNSDRSQHRAPEGESMLEVQNRMAEWIWRCAGAGQSVVGVSHADVIKAACCYALGLPLDAHARFEIAPGSVSVLLVDAWGVKVERLNGRML